MTALLIIAYALSVVATVADIETTKPRTVYGPGGTVTIVYESSTVYGPHPSRLKLYVVGALMAGGVITVSILFALIHWNYASYVPPIPLIAIRGYAAIKNYRLNRKLQKVDVEVRGVNT